MPFTINDLIAKAQEVGTLQQAYQDALATSTVSAAQAAADQAATDQANAAADTAIDELVAIAADLKDQ